MGVRGKENFFAKSFPSPENILATFPPIAKCDIPFGITKNIVGISNSAEFDEGLHACRFLYVPLRAGRNKHNKTTCRKNPVYCNY